ncbi:50S ribosomal protein L6 [Candidatus Micrarchaeota archaeon]|nr:50S ribosomal protein L6 [Candidatus Micrarchaeota archaeon]
MEIPDGITLTVDGLRITAKGPKGEVSKNLSKKAQVRIDGKKVDIIADKALKGTLESIISSMLEGVKEGHRKKLKMLYAHFPISIEIKGQNITIKNFLGERQARKTKLIGNTKVEVKGQDITVSGPDKEAVGQTAANLIEAVKIKEKDGRIFQDGIYGELS